MKPVVVMTDSGKTQTDEVELIHIPLIGIEVLPYEVTIKNTMTGLFLRVRMQSKCSVRTMTSPQTTLRRSAVRQSQRSKTWAGR